MFFNRNDLKLVAAIILFGVFLLVCGSRAFAWEYAPQVGVMFTWDISEKTTVCPDHVTLAVTAVPVAESRTYISNDNRVTNNTTSNTTNNTSTSTTKVTSTTLMNTTNVSNTTNNTTNNSTTNNTTNNTTSYQSTYWYTSGDHTNTNVHINY